MESNIVGGDLVLTPLKVPQKVLTPPCKSKFSISLKMLLEIAWNGLRALARAALWWNPEPWLDDSWWKVLSIKTKRVMRIFDIIIDAVEIFKGHFRTLITEPLWSLKGKNYSPSSFSRNFFALAYWLGPKMTLVKTVPKKYFFHFY